MEHNASLNGRLAGSPVGALGWGVRPHSHPPVLLVGLAGCEIGLCAFVRPRVPCVPCVSRLPPVSFYRCCGQKNAKAFAARVLGGNRAAFRTASAR